MLIASFKRLWVLVALLAMTGCDGLLTSVETDGGMDVADAGSGDCQFTGCDDSNPCTTDICTATGCEHSPSSGATCDDKNACTQSDVCQDGVCVGSDPVTCDAPGTCQEQGTCDPTTGECSYPILTPGTSCDDSDVGTYNDACNETGVCVGLAAQCPENSACVTYKPDGTADCAATALDAVPCNDGDACTQTDVCVQGVCEGSNPVTCGAPGVCEEQGTCNAGTGQCSHPLSIPGTPCDDGSASTYSDSCSAGGMCGGLTVTCPADTACVTYAPNGTGTCTATPRANDTACNDGNACTKTDTCQEGVCVGTNPVTCAAPKVCETQGVCDPTSGVCSTPSVQSGVACDDGNVATYNDTCNGSGACAGTVVNCPADTACATYVPNGTSTCSPVYLDGDPCDDSDACTPTGACNHGTCVTPPAVTCGNGSQCVNGTCACPTGWTGPTCSTDVNECTQNPNVCGGGSSCTNTPGSYTCACIPNYSSPTGANCTNSVAALELVFFYDEGAARKLGPDPEAKLEQIFTRAKWLYDNDPGLKSGLPLTLSLNGQVRLKVLPSSMTMRACNTPDPSRPSCIGCWGGFVPSDCSQAWSTSADEIDVTGLLNGFINYTHVTRKTNLNNFSGGIDVPVFFTDADFASNTIGLGSVAAACNAFSGAVVQLLNASDINETALTLTHELGHNLSMQHDASGAPYIMAPAIDTTNTSFSPASISSYTTWRNNLGSTNCISDVAKDDWRSHLCGNGKIDPGESCDPGMETDSCCSSTCQLNPGCLCANTEVCCQNGTPKAAGTTCRTASGSCDIADTCDGQSGECRDVYEAPGTACGNGGTCLQKECAPSRTEQCASINGGQYPTSTGCASSTSCTQLVCNLGGTCNLTWSVGPEDGSPCGAGKQCQGGVCVPQASLKEYAWVTGIWSTCSGGHSTRTIGCADEEGNPVSSSLCSAATAPATSRTCAP